MKPILKELKLIILCFVIGIYPALIDQLNFTLTKTIIYKSINATNIFLN